MHAGQIAYAHALYLAQLCRHNVFACAAQPWVAWAWASGGWGAICIQHSPQNSYFNLLTTTPFAPLHSYNTAHTQATQLLQGVTIVHSPWTLDRPSTAHPATKSTMKALHYVALKQHNEIYRLTTFYRLL